MNWTKESMTNLIGYVQARDRLSTTAVWKENRFESREQKSNGRLTKQEAVQKFKTKCLNAPT